MHRKLFLQMFAESGADTASGTQVESTGTEPDAKPEQEQTDPISRSELDSQISKAVAKALENSDKKWQKLLDDSVATARTEAEKYAKMSADEKRKAEQDRERAAFAAEKAAFEKEKLLLAVKGDLQKNSLPLSFADSLVEIADADRIKDAVAEIKKTWDAEIAEAIRGKARQSTPGESGQAATRGHGTINIGQMARDNRIIK